MKMAESREISVPEIPESLKKERLALDGKVAPDEQVKPKQFMHGEWSHFRVNFTRHSDKQGEHLHFHFYPRIAGVTQILPEILQKCASKRVKKDGVVYFEWVPEAKSWFMAAIGMADHPIGKWLTTDAPDGFFNLVNEALKAITAN